MLAPDIIMKRFVDSRVFLANVDDLVKPSDKVDAAANNSVTVDMEAVEPEGDMMAMDDLMDTFDPELNEIFLRNESSSNHFKLKNTAGSCYRR